MTNRDTILQKIRSSLGAADGDVVRQKAVARRLKAHPRGVIPDIGENKDAVLCRFEEKARQAGASVETVTRRGIARAISTFLREHNLPQQLRMGDDRRLKAIEWPKRGAPDILRGPSDGNDPAGLSYAFAGAGETGTLVLLSGADNPTTINFLPENHIVLIDAADIASGHEAIWTRLRRKLGSGKMPRTVNMITGPSRSADIEQTLIMGAHGPVRLHVIVVKG